MDSLVSVIAWCFANLLFVNGCSITGVLMTSYNTSRLHTGDNFNVIVSLKLPSNCKVDMNISVFTKSENDNHSLPSYNVFSFESGYVAILSNVLSLAKEVPLKEINHGVYFDYGFIDAGKYVPSNSSLYINFTLLVTVTNETSQDLQQQGNIIVGSNGDYRLEKPYSITGTRRIPDLMILKQVKVTGDDSTIYEVNITILHSLRSLNDAFSLQVSDSVHGMDIISINVLPNIQSKSSYSGSYSHKKVVGHITHLKLGSTVSIIYQSYFLRNKDPITSISRATIIWSDGNSSMLKFGPKYSNSSCVVKHLQEKKSFVENYGYLILGIVLGIIAGCLVATVIILCLKRCPSTKRYILHTDEVVGITSNETVTKVPIPYATDLEVTNETNRENNVFKKFVHNFKKNDLVDTTDAPLLPTLLMWQSSFFKGDIDTSANLLNKHFVAENMSLLEFTLNLWVYIWKQTLRIHVDKLFSNGKIDLERKNKSLEALASIVEPINQLTDNSMKDVGVFVDVMSDTVLKYFYKGIDIYDDLLRSVKIKRVKNETTKTRNSDALKEIREQDNAKEEKEREEFIHLHTCSLYEDFTNIFDKYLETLHYISCMVTNVQLHTVSSGILMVILEQSISLIDSWIRHTVAKKTDLLKRKRLLNEDLDGQFQEVLREELKQVITHMLLRRQKIIEKSESSSISNYSVQRATVDETYSQILDASLSELKGNIDETPNVRKVVTLQELIEKFKISLQYKDSIKLVVDENMSFYYSLSNLLDAMSQPLNIFYLRMKTHVFDFHNESTNKSEFINEFGSYVGDPVELQQVADINHLAVIISNLEQKSSELVSKLTTLLEEDIEVIKDKEIDFHEIHSGLLIKRKSRMFELMTLQHILFKSIIQCHCPLSWVDSIRLIEMAPKSCISAFCKEYICFEFFADYNFRKQIDLIIQNDSVEIATSSILRKFELLNQEIVNEIDHIYSIAKDCVQNVIEDSNCIHRFQKGNFSYVMLNIKRLKQQTHVLNLTSRFLMNIFTQLEEADIEIDKEMLETLNNFRKKSKKIINSLSTKMTKESEIEFRSKLSDVLNKYLSTCSLFVLQTHNKVSTLTFNVDEVSNNVLEMGRQQKFIEDRIVMCIDLIAENRYVMKLLLGKKMISAQELFRHFRDLSMCLSNDELTLVGKLMLGEDSSLALKDIFTVIMDDNNDEDDDDEDEA